MLLSEHYVLGDCLTAQLSSDKNQTSWVFVATLECRQVVVKVTSSMNELAILQKFGGAHNILPLLRSVQPTEVPLVCHLFDYAYFIKGNFGTAIYS